MDKIDNRIQERKDYLKAAEVIQTGNVPARHGDLVQVIAPYLDPEQHQGARTRIIAALGNKAEELSAKNPTHDISFGLNDDKQMGRTILSASGELLAAIRAEIKATNTDNPRTRTPASFIATPTERAEQLLLTTDEELLKKTQQEQPVLLNVPFMEGTAVRSALFEIIHAAEVKVREKQTSINPTATTNNFSGGKKSTLIVMDERVLEEARRSVREMQHEVDTQIAAQKPAVAVAVRR